MTTEEYYEIFETLGYHVPLSVVQQHVNAFRYRKAIKRHREAFGINMRAYEKRLHRLTLQTLERDILRAKEFGIV